jgi:hypothetical protein
LNLGGGGGVSPKARGLVPAAVVGTGAGAGAGTVAPGCDPSAEFAGNGLLEVMVQSMLKSGEEQRKQRKQRKQR